MKNLATLSSKARARGISLIEAVLYLVIALAVIVGGIVFFQQAQLSNQVTDTSRASVGISSQTRALYQNQRSFGTDPITAALLQSGAVPSNFVAGAGTEDSPEVIQHPFGGNIVVTGAEAGFTLTFDGMSAAACTRLATVGEGGDGPLGTGIATMQINGATAAAVVTAADAAAGCAADSDLVVTYNR